MRPRVNTFMVVTLAVAFLAGAAQGQSPDSRPAPGEEVMRPTQRGLRLTPSMARAASQAFMRDTLWQDMDLTEDQERRVADAAARRMMRIAHRDGREGQPAVEYFIETMIRTQGRVNPQNCREFGEKMQPLARGFREFIEGSLEDARPVLNEQQLKELEIRVARQRRGMDNFERRLQNYREGRAEENENPFDEFEAAVQNEPGQPKVDPRVRNARRTAEWEIRRVTSWEWSRFLAGATATFKFDDAQKAAGDALLAQFRKKADAVQTPEWKARIQRNRMLSNLQWQLGDVPRGPWRYRLDIEFKEATRPLTDMTGEFYSAVLALATPQQRADALEEVRRMAEKHGLTVGEADLGLLQSLIQPAPSLSSGG